MFKYSKNWLSKIAYEDIDYKDFDRNWLDLQGFEVATETKINDDVIIELEVKANRPDILSHLGVLREYYVYKNKIGLPNIKSKLNLIDMPLSINVKIESNDVDNLVLIEIKNIDNSKETPKEIKELLENLAVNSINPVVDISNYICLEIGQQIHIYDLNKINDSLIYTNSNGVEKIKTLNGSEINIPNESIIIKDSSGPICLAGIIGTEDVDVDNLTKNILIEAAHFNMPKIRISSQKTHITTLSSYRFEKGIDSDNVLNACLLTAEKIIELCGGSVFGSYTKLNKKPENIKNVKISKINKLLGTELNGKEIVNLLNQYYYDTKLVNNDTINCICPRYRLDIEQDVDIIADVAQIYGYHNIKPKIANISVKYEPNQVMINNDILRNIMVSQGLNECISYSFIHENAMKILNIDNTSELYGDIKLLNPLSNKYALMRPNMIYSMLNTYIYNLSKNAECEPIFEIGTIYYKDNKTDTGYNQKQMLSVILNGNKYIKGFGLDKNIPHDFYDIKSILELIATEYSLNICLKESNKSPFKKCANIYIEDKYSGVIGILAQDIVNNLENGKLIKGDVYYLELCINNIKMGTTPIDEISKYPSVIREYNLLVPNGMEYKEYTNSIKEVNELVKDIQIKDIYKGKGVQIGFTSILISIEYSSINRSLKLEEIEDIERKWLEIISMT